MSPVRIPGWELEVMRAHLLAYDQATAQDDRKERLRLSRTLAAHCRTLLAEIERIRQEQNTKSTS